MQAQEKKSRGSVRKKLIFDPIQQWLTDIRSCTENECMSVLQGKSLLSDLERTAHNIIILKNGIDHVKNEAHRISNRFSKLFKYVDSERWENIHSQALDLSCHVRTIIQNNNLILKKQPDFIVEQQETVMRECAKLVQLVEGLKQTENKSAKKIPIVNQLSFLGQSFSKMVDLTLGTLMQKVVDILDEETDAVTLTSALNTIISLGLEGEHMCYIFAREGGVRSLLDILRTQALQYVHGLTLRVLTTVCCVSESIFEIEKEGGIDCLKEMLCDYSNGEIIRGEVAGVLAQVTSPCLENFQQLSGMMEAIDEIIRALLGLCANTLSQEVFLLSAAAIANITFMDASTCSSLLKYEAHRILIAACRNEVAQSIFVRDQIATIIANMVAVDSCRDDIIACHGIKLCLDLLHENPTLYSGQAEVSACERVQQKAAIALSRLCKEQGTAHSVAAKGGISRLVNLCRNRIARHNSDAVLVACLAALRKACSLCKGENVVSEIDYRQLVQPKLMDSFLICTNTEENFVKTFGDIWHIFDSTRRATIY